MRSLLFFVLEALSFTQPNHENIFDPNYLKLRRSVVLLKLRDVYNPRFACRSDIANAFETMLSFYRRRTLHCYEKRIDSLCIKDERCFSIRDELCPFTRDENYVVADLSNIVFLSAKNKIC